jgi:hypothetical protein
LLLLENAYVLIPRGLGEFLNCRMLLLKCGGKPSTAADLLKTQWLVEEKLVRGAREKQRSVRD